MRRHTISSLLPPNPTALTSGGIWTLNESIQYIRADTWQGRQDYDPYFSNVVLLTHINSDTGFLDYSSNSWTPTSIGGMTVSTTSPKFGDACLVGSTGKSVKYYFRGTNQNLGTNFTIEMWIKNLNAISLYPIYLSNTAAGDHIYISNLRLLNNQGPLFFDVGSGWNDNTWKHFAICRNGTTVTTYIGGIQGNQQTGVSIDVAPDSVELGAGNNGSAAFTGSIDEVRITKNVCRYTGNFTPPTAPFPNS